MRRTSSAPPTPAVAVIGDGERLALEGALDVHTLAAFRDSLSRRLASGQAKALDIGGLQALDTPGALFLCALGARGVALTGARPEHRALLDLIGGLPLQPLPVRERVARWRERVIALGRGAHEAGRDALELIGFVGRAASLLGHALRHPRELRPASISRQVAETGIHAMPIVGLMAVMISVVVGYQGVAQLRPYGAEDFTINLVAVSVLREMGVLITAIMVAGRSGSAFTAEIGVMKAREEVDALEIMGLPAVPLLVLPRLIGLVLTLPLLTFFADMLGLAGGALIAQALLDVSPWHYVDRVHHAVDASDLFVGLIKAPVFAFFIAIIGCMHGLRVRASAESVGRETTRAVVKSIFVVIVLDAFFSVLFERLGL
jgi:phospholipid/cholesterol/gamma-HCH transport system permease protein